MNRTHRSRLNAPIINKVVELNKYLLLIRSKAYRAISYNYIDDELKKGNTLFYYALRQLRGLDYKKRATELTMEIQSGIYLITALGGCLERQAAVIDVICDDIISQLSKMDAAGTVKS